MYFQNMLHSTTDDYMYEWMFESWAGESRLNLESLCHTLPSQNEAVDGFKQDTDRTCVSYFILIVCHVTCESVTCYSHWYEHRTVICSTQLGDTVQEDRGHLLVLVLYKAEYFKGKATHLAFPIFKDGGLGVFFTAGSGKENYKVLLERMAREISEMDKIIDLFSNLSYLKKRS